MSHRRHLFGAHVETWIWLSLKRKGTNLILVTFDKLEEFTESDVKEIGL